MLTVDFDYFDLQPEHVCLDLGCGEGRHALTAYLAEGVQVLGVDLAHQDLKTAASRIDDMADYQPKGHIQFLQSDGGRLPLADSSVDRLICSEVLEHIPNYIHFLEEIHRVLKPDGRLCISVPRAWPEWVCWTLCDAYRRTPGGHIEFLMLDTYGERSSATILNARDAMEPTLFMFPIGGLSVCFGTATRNPLLFVDTIAYWCGI